MLEGNLRSTLNDFPIALKPVTCSAESASKQVFGSEENKSRFTDHQWIVFLRDPAVYWQPVQGVMGLQAQAPLVQEKQV